MREKELGESDAHTVSPFPLDPLDSVQVLGCAHRYSKRSMEVKSA